MKRNRWFGLALAATIMGASFSACSNDAEEVLAQESEIRLTSEINPSRVAALDYQSTQIVSGQQVGVTITGAVGTHVNQPWSAANGGVLNNIGEKVYWGNESVTITAYHPYDKDWTFDEVNDFTVSTNQTLSANYLTSDLLWCKVENQAKTENPITLTFTHKLAKINVSLTSTDVSASDLESATISICGTKVATTFNPSTGALGTVTGNVEEIAAGTNTKTASAIIVPQTVAKDTKLIRVAIEGKVYYYTLPEDTEFVTGKSYSYTLTVKKKQLEISAKMNITNWSDTPLTGNANETTETEGKVVHVETAGNLYTYIDEDEKLAITSLTVTGNLNSDDIRFIREMAGRTSSGQNTEGQLVNLDMSGASIVTGGEPYYSNNTTSANTIGAHMFEYCKLKSIVLPSSTSSIAINAFYVTTGLESVRFTSDFNCTSLFNLMFPMCGFTTPDGTSFIVDENNEELYSIDGTLFWKQVQWNMQEQIITDHLMLYGRHHENYTVPEGTEAIAAFSFLYNAHTKSITIPSTIKAIGECSIGNCSELKELYCYAVEPPTCDGNTPFNNINDLNNQNSNITSTCTLYVPRESIDLYKEATHWKDFTNIQPIEE